MVLVATTGLDFKTSVWIMKNKISRSKSVTILATWTTGSAGRMPVVSGSSTTVKIWESVAIPLFKRVSRQ